MIYRSFFLILITLFINCRLLVATENTDAGIEIKKPSFIIDSNLTPTNEINLFPYIQELANQESPLTTFLSYHGDPQDSDYSRPIKNLAFINFISVLDDGTILETGGKSIEDKIIVFESGEGSWLKNIKTLAVERKKTYNTLELIPIFDAYDLDLSPQFIKETEDSPDVHLQIFNHFNLFWGTTFPKDNIDNKLLLSGTQFARPIIELTSVTGEGKENVHDKMESIKEFIEEVENQLELLDLTIVPSESSSFVFASTLSAYLKMTLGLEAIQKTIKESEKELKQIVQMINKTKNRLCGEQKAARYIVENMNYILGYLRASIPQGKMPKILFLLLHSYQDPCPTCRFTFRRLSKYFFQDKMQIIFPNIKFHIVASYRENFPEGRKDFPVRIANEEVISLSDSSCNSISLFKIDPSSEPIIAENVNSSMTEEEKIFGFTDSFLGEDEEHGDY